ncbi:MAG: HugZ family protein [Ruegeria sp.]|uniref:HugZ family pyridoxamine 5'-phosphate oxidase n=1 Tax=Ruegeria sp. TaxID=1879320 RepID=UPI00349EA28E
MAKPDPFQPADDAARSLARELVRDATHAALAVLRPGTTLPSVTRIALATDAKGRPVSLISDLAPHTQALTDNPACALLIGEPGPKGDPLTHPRLTLHCSARLIERNTPEHTTLRDRYLSLRPKVKLYADFADFRFVTFMVTDGLLNGGFGKAFLLTPKDL